MSVMELYKRDERAEKILDNLFYHKLPLPLIRAAIESISHNDKGHDITHVIEVCSRAKEICDLIETDNREKLMAFTGAMLHDLGCRYDRQYHHVIGVGLAYRMIEEHAPGFFTEQEMKQIGVAILEHRSSNKSKPSTKVSEIVSIADTGKPSIDTYIKRTILFRIDKIVDDEELIQDCYEHVLEKYHPETGYNWVSYPEIGRDFYHEEWNKFFDIIMDKERCLSLYREALKKFR